MPLFFAPDFAVDPRLPADESYHAVKVLRLRAADPVEVVDGKGTWYQARVQEAHPKACRLEVLAQRQVAERPYRLHVALAPTKSIDRTEWFVEKAVELGVDEITPLLVARSERRQLKEERLQRIAISAMKQSQRATLPRLNPLTPLPSFWETVPPDAQRFVAHLEEGRRQALRELIAPRRHYVVLVGPEGDFTPDEIAAARQENFLPVTLGDFRLRTETAGIAVCHTVALLHEGFSA
ncbi:16S rRNA (uracil1498-N3)-methyltransferase [Catalinimonas alkaloidigena]|uniref:Ribosomal RNA small subunit methyltransferase E n=1 Tax=Catalinimonas alkaloidigena TaxID=1075417 RepID=A0A1G9GU80_9BACT|nr:16S rRNA (uracil(1498)-N(3))-methyltransferase [Catalinimonas alkaloidigena]SDL04249.1 16S rRNA (uracil1498-N3)-methyltransferase [Catalinimonas alkaloidigena]